LFTAGTLFKKRVDLICRIHYCSDRYIVIERINDQGKELAHVRRYKIRLLVQFRRQISQISCNYFIDVSFIVIIVKFIKSVCKQPECGAYEDTAGITLFYLPGYIQHTPAG